MTEKSWPRSSPRSTLGKEKSYKSSFQYFYIIIIFNNNVVSFSSLSDIFRITCIHSFDPGLGITTDLVFPLRQHVEGDVIT